MLAGLIVKMLVEVMAMGADPLFLFGEKSRPSLPSCSLARR